MAKLRKMLGRADSPEATELMRLMETQSVRTLTLWATDRAREGCLALLDAAEAQAAIAALDAARAAAKGECPAKSARSAINGARKAAGELTDPVKQAAARALATAAATCQTPTSALGFLFYEAAARAYAEAGLCASAGEYDRLGEADWRSALESLRSAAIPDEPNPAKPDWGCKP